jgi:hypothetical protein
MKPVKCCISVRYCLSPILHILIFRCHPVACRRPESAAAVYGDIILFNGKVTVAKVPFTITIPLIFANNCSLDALMNWGIDAKVERSFCFFFSSFCMWIAGDGFRLWQG